MTMASKHSKAQVSQLLAGLRAKQGAMGAGPSADAAVHWAYVANAFDNTLSVVDLHTRQECDTIALGEGPFGVAVHPDGSRVYVSNTHDDSVSVVHLPTGAVRTVPVGYGPHGLAIHPSGRRVYVANFEGNSVSVIDALTHQVREVPVGTSPLEVLVSPCGRQVYVSNHGCNSIAILDGMADDPSASVGWVNGMRWPSGMALHAEAGLLYVCNAEDHTVSVIDVSCRQELNAVRVGRGPSGLALSPSGQLLLATNWDADSVSVLDVSTPQRPVMRKTLAVGSSPRGVAFRMDGREACVTNADSNTVSVIDAHSLTVVDTIAVGNGPYSPGAFVAPAVVSACAAGTPSVPGVSNATLG